VEAYVLEWVGKAAPLGAKYSVVLWRNGPEIKENVDPRPMFGKTEAVSVAGWRQIKQGMEWNLGPIQDKLAENKILIADQPRVIFCDELPQWKLTTSQEWLAKQPLAQEQSNAVVPAMGK
jgi:hypothetical protein